MILGHLVLELFVIHDKSKVPSIIGKYVDLVDLFMIFLSYSILTLIDRGPCIVDCGKTFKAPFIPCTIKGFKSLHTMTSSLSAKLLTEIVRLMYRKSTYYSRCRFEAERYIFRL